MVGGTAANDAAAADSLAPIVVLEVAVACTWPLTFHDGGGRCWSCEVVAATTTAVEAGGERDCGSDDDGGGCCCSGCCMRAGGDCWVLDEGRGNRIGPLIRNVAQQLARARAQAFGVLRVQQPRRGVGVGTVGSGGDSDGDKRQEATVTLTARFTKRGRCGLLKLCVDSGDSGSEAMARTRRAA